MPDENGKLDPFYKSIVEEFGQGLYFIHTAIDRLIEALDDESWGVNHLEERLETVEARLEKLESKRKSK